MSTYAVILLCFLSLGMCSKEKELSLDIKPYDIAEGSTTITFGDEDEFGKDTTGFIYIKPKDECAVVSIFCDFKPDESEPCGATTLRISIKTFNFAENGFSIHGKASFQLKSEKFFLGLQTTKKSRGGTFCCEATCAVTKKEKAEMTGSAHDHVHKVMEDFKSKLFH